MSRFALRFARKAEDDLIDIWNYVAQHNAGAADRLLKGLETRLRLLADYPFAGRIREDMADGTRHLAIGEYLTFYRVAEHTVQIIRVLHGHRDITAKDMR
ncbi:MAG: type II toxin-antitoxin system RelE/ParE family toxin [Rhizobiales bacterium]|nr:type II toxin-antitoxin system RelE/ParE family toxin [Hyphomicrobiales bacterium]